MRQTRRMVAIIAGTVLLGACASVQNQNGGANAGTSVRVVDGAAYRVLGGETLILYTRERNVMSGKRFEVVVDRFFSTSPAAPVQPLTLETLKRAYPTNREFHYLLMLEFRSDAELVRYDEYHREYLVERLLRRSLTTEPPPTQRVTLSPRAELSARCWRASPVNDCCSSSPSCRLS